MSGELKTVGRHTAIYAVGVVASKLVSFIMLPVYTRYLTPSDYGILELLGTTIDVIGMIGGIGLAAGVFKQYAELGSAEDRRELISTAAIGSSALALLVTAAGLAASPLLTRLVLGADQPVTYFRIFFLIYLFQSMSNVGLLYVQAEERSMLFVALNVGKLATTLGLTILLVVHRHMRIEGVLLASLVGSVLFALVLAGYTVRRAGVHFSRHRFARLSRFGAPIVVWTVGSFILTFSDRYFLNHAVGPAAVGVYSLAYKFSFLLSAFAVAPFSQIWEPKRFEIARQPDAGDIYRRMFFYLNVAMFLGTGAIILFIRDGLTLLVGPAFVAAYRVVPLLLVTTIVQQWTGYCNLGLYLRNATHLYGWSAVVGVVAALALNALLIPRYGVMGAAWATVTAYVVRFIPVYAFAQARYHVSYGWGRIASLGVLLFAVWGARVAADALSTGPSLTVSVALLAAMLAGLYLLLEPQERAFVSRMVHRPFGALVPRTD